MSGFLQNAKLMVSFVGEIHISHKTTHPFSEWDIKGLATNEGLIFIEEVEFKKHFYPCYNNKKGSGSKCDKNFPIRESSTFQFC